MQYIVFDLEWNQRTGSKKQSKPGLPFEIIEIGAVKLDKAGRIVSRFSETIRPVIYKEMNFYTGQVTHMNMRELKHARGFCEVAKDFFAWCGKEYFFCTWGSSDLEVLQQNMAIFGVENHLPVPLLYYDVQKLYSMQYQDGKERRALELAVEQLEIAHADDFHRALQDAYYTACVWKKLERVTKKYFSVDYYSLPTQEEKLWRFDFETYTKLISCTYPKKTNAVYDKEIRRNFCIKCGAELKTRLPWFPMHQKLCASLGECEEHGVHQAKLRVRQTQEGFFFTIKTIKLANEKKQKKLLEKYEGYLEAEENAKKRRENNE